MKTSSVSYPIVGKLRSYRSADSAPKSADIPLPTVVEVPPVTRKKSVIPSAIAATIMGVSVITVPAAVLGTLTGKFAHNGFSVNKTIVDVQKSVSKLLKK